LKYLPSTKDWSDELKGEHRIFVFFFIVAYYIVVNPNEFLLLAYLYWFNDLSLKIFIGVEYLVTLSNIYFIIDFYCTKMNKWVDMLGHHK